MGSKFAIEAVFRAIDKMTKPLKKMGINSKKFTAGLRQEFSKAQRQLSNFGRSLKQFAGRAIRIGIAGAVGVAALAVRGFVKQASMIEDAVAGFTPLLGGVEKATKLVEMLNKEAATTPFQFENISDVAKQLLPVMNGNLDKTVSTFRMLGDTAGGNMQKLETITRGYTKALLKGKPDMEALNMIAEAGVPIFSEMAKGMGITTQQLFELSRQGKLTNQDLERAFKQMTSKGGLFFNGMGIASETLSGKFSTFKDNVALTAAEFGQVLLPILKKFLDRGIEILANIREWVDANQDLIRTKVEDFIERIIGFSKRAWEIITKVVDVVRELAPFLKAAALAFVIYKAAVMAATVVQWALNAAMAANPIGLIILGIAALAGAIAGLVINWDEAMAMMTFMWLRFGEVVSGAFRPIIAFLKEALELVRTFFQLMTAPGLKLGERLKGMIEAQASFDVAGRRQEMKEARGERVEDRRGVSTARESLEQFYSKSETTAKAEVIIKNDGTIDALMNGEILPAGGLTKLLASG